MEAADVAMWIGLGLAALIVLLTVVSLVRGGPSRNDRRAQADGRINPIGSLFNDR